MGPDMQSGVIDFAMDVAYMAFRKFRKLPLNPICSVTMNSQSRLTLTKAFSVSIMISGEGRGLLCNKRDKILKII